MVEVRIGFMLGLAGMVRSWVRYYSHERNVRKCGGGVMTQDHIVPGVITRGITAGSFREFRFIKPFFLFKFLGYKLSRASGVWPRDLVLWCSESCGRVTRSKSILKRQGQHVIGTSASLHCWHCNHVLVFLL